MDEYTTDEQREKVYRPLVLDEEYSAFDITLDAVYEKEISEPL